ncbi:hypothetical protein [Azospirillum endophyticum]
MNSKKAAARNRGVDPLRAAASGTGGRDTSEARRRKDIGRGARRHPDGRDQKS